MSRNNLVTIYITNFNYGKYIQLSIESVLNQTFQNFELLIIDDGSTDNSKEVIERYRQHEKVSIIYQRNKGLNITNNIAMRAAQGKYIVRLDADDFLAPEAIAEMTNVLEADDSLGLVFPDYYYVDSHGVVTGEERRHNFEKEVSLYDQPAHGACTMIRLSFLKALGGYNESFTCQDGYDLWIKFVTHHKVTNINKPLFYYRRHESNLTNNEDKILSTRKLIKEHFVKEHFKTPATVAVIPVRNTFIGEINWPLYKFKGKSILNHKIEESLASDKLSKVIVSTSDREILDHCKYEIPPSEKLIIVERPQEYSRASESLSKTLVQAIHQIEKEGNRLEAIMTISLEYPFLTTDIIDDAINTITLFKSDAVLSVRPDNRMFYQHNGHSLVPILEQDKFTKLEREALYMGAGGVVLSTIDNFKKEGKLVAGRISHIVVDQKTAFSVNDPFSLELFKAHSHEIIGS
jgi:glycosyltransferase involved in cell wall biosynthesis